MGVPAAAVAARFAWVGYRDKIPFRPRRSAASDVATLDVDAADEPDLVEADTCASS